MSKKNRVWVIIGSVFVVLIAGLFFFRVEIARAIFARGFEVSPVDNFKYEFSTPIEQISGLQGGGSTWMDHHDTYLRFYCEHAAKLNGSETYKKSGIEAAPIAFFKEKFPRDSESLDDSLNLVVYSKEMVPGRIKKCLVYNARTGTCFFRVWK